MAMRSMWKGSISFGMVVIPIKMYTTVDDNVKSVRNSIHQMHTDCGTRLQMPKWCPKCERKVESAEVGRAYYTSEKEDGLAFSLTAEEMASLPVESMKAVNIQAFVPWSSNILQDPRWSDTVYAIAPEDIGKKAFCLLRDAMTNRGVVGLAKIAVRDREKLAMLRPMDEVMLIQTLHFAAELRDLKELERAAELSEAEMTMGIKLVDSMTHEVDMEAFTDAYHEALVDLINHKLEGKEYVVQSVPDKQATGEDLLASLAASLGEAVDLTPGLAATEKEFQEIAPGVAKNNQ